MKVTEALQVFSYCVLCLFTCSSAQWVNGTRTHLDRTLSALMDALLFYDREHMFVNLDAISWTRMVEGQLTVLLRKISSNPQNWNVDSNTLERIRQIIIVSGIVSDKARPYIARDAPVYHNRLGPLLDFRFWELDYNTRDIPPSVVIYPYRSGEAIGGQTSDGCIGTLVGTVGPSRCNVTPYCWRSMTSPGYFGYSLSHEIWWLQIGELSGCSAQMESMRRIQGSPPIPRIQEGLCANMLAESMMIANNGYPYERRDLFMEDIAFCGMYGFRAFFNRHWLERILNWQDSQHGCFMLIPRRRGSLVRKKRAERQLRHGCLSHLTGVAIGALAQYVRYILELQV